MKSNTSLARVYPVINIFFTDKKTNTGTQYLSLHLELLKSQNSNGYISYFTYNNTNI